MDEKISPFVARIVEADADALPSNGRIGIVDIGSNTVRLVVFDAPARLPVPVFNERVSCRLGKGLGKFGKLNPKGVELAFRSLKRFTSLAREMQVESFVMLATAAVREAEDGEQFAKEVESRFGYPVQILDGTAEACLGATGILGGSPDADGLFGDLGGGSLDLVALDRGDFGANATVPLGHLRVSEDSGKSTTKAKSLVDRHLKKLDWLADIEDRTLYAVGGAWRALARIYIEQNKYPLHVLDNFTVEGKAARELTKVISGLSPRSLETMSGVARRRADTLPYAALVMNRLIKRANPKEVVFSGYGLREGQFFEMLPEKMKKQDPLISACEGFAKRSGRFSVHGSEIVDWVAPLFPGATPADHRVCHATALLSDIGWTEHPDYRALHAFIRILRLPIAGVSHRDRILLALSVFVRYNGKRKQYEVKQVRNLLDENDQHFAAILGLALRLAHTLSGGVPGILPKSHLELTGRKLTLHLGEAGQVLLGEAVEKLFYELAETLGIEGAIN